MILLAYYFEHILAVYRNLFKYTCGVLGRAVDESSYVDFGRHLFRTNAVGVELSVSSFVSISYKLPLNWSQIAKSYSFCVYRDAEFTKLLYASWRVCVFKNFFGYWASIGGLGEYRTGDRLVVGGWTVVDFVLNFAGVDLDTNSLLNTPSLPRLEGLGGLDVVVGDDRLYAGIENL